MKACETIKLAWLKDRVTFESEIKRQARESESEANADLMRGINHDSVVIRAKFNRSANLAGALRLCLNDDFEAFGFLLSQGILALNIACKILEIPSHVRTRIAVETWENS